MHVEILTPAQVAVLERLKDVPAVREFHLAGGTALAFFDDAEREPMPDMLVPFDWEEAKRFFTAGATRLLAAGIG